jgi:hypothetical protein
MQQILIRCLEREQSVQGELFQGGLHGPGLFVHRACEQLGKISDGAVKSIGQRDGGFPAEACFGEGDVRLALLGIVRRQWAEDDLGFATDFLQHLLGEGKHGEFTGIAEIDRTGEIVGFHELDEAADEVIDVAETARLLAVAVDGDVVAFERLDDEVGDDTAVIRQHARAVGVEDADDADVHAVLTVVVEEEGFSDTLALVIAGAGADGIDVAPVALGLGMHLRIAIDFRGGSLEHARLEAACEAEHVDGTHHGGLDRLDGVVLIMRRGGGAGEIVDLIHLDTEGVRDVMPDELKVRVVHQVGDVLLATGEQVVRADDFMVLLQQTFAEMGAEEPGPTGDENTFFHG